MKNKYKMRYISNITCYKTVPKAVEYEGKLKKRGGSQASLRAKQGFLQANEAFYPPAMAGTMLTSSPDFTGVSDSFRNRISSSFRKTLTNRRI